MDAHAADTFSSRVAPEEWRFQGRHWRIRAELLDLLLAPSGVEHFLERVVTRLARLFDASHVAFWQYVPAGDRLVVSHRAYPRAEEPAIPMGLLHEAVEGRQVKTAAVPLGPDELTLFLLGPVYQGGTFEGVVQVNLPSPYLDTQAAEELALATETIAQCLQVVRRHEQLSFFASRDPLTGLANRRSFEVDFDREFKLAERHETPLSLVILDVDHFKVFNDTYGHPAGDALLRGVGGAIAHAVRSTDFVARYGGEEFVIVLPHTDQVGAEAAAEKVLDAIRHLPHVPGGRVTASIGTATFPDDAHTAQALLQAADQAMYGAKRAGRNQVSQA